MTFTSDPRVVAYRHAVNDKVTGPELLEAERGFAGYMLEGTAPALRMVTLRVLAREGVSRLALIAAAALTVEESDDLPLPDREDDPHSALRAMPYTEYLKTDHWHFTRELAIGRAGGKCAVCCDDKAPLEVHHRTYENRGAELPGDLIVLCAGCHSLFHEHGKLAA